MMLSCEHDRAYTLFMQNLVEPASLGEDEIQWLEAHLGGCGTCATRCLDVASGLKEMRSPGVVATTDLVRRTQSRVHAKARELDRRRERAVPLKIAAAAALGWMLVSTPLLWEGFARIGGRFNVPGPVWESGFVFTWLAPTAFVAVAALSNREKRMGRG